MSAHNAPDLAPWILDVPDFPKAGIVFKDITPLLASGPALQSAVEALRSRYASRKIDQVVAIESRGFLLGAPLAFALGVGLTLVRKPGKLPRETRHVSYALEYGEDTLHLHADALNAGDRVLLVDDVLATGGTAEAASRLVESCGGELVELAFLMELGLLEGRKRLGERAVYSLLEY